MQMTFSQDDIAHYRQRLTERAGALTDEIRATVARSRDERFVDVAGAVRDTEDASLADLVVAVNQADVSRDVGELREINAALARISAGEYGVCTDCWQPIGRARLDAWPTARRCIVCQERYEETHATASTPTL